jgi:hypothetical protein
LKERVIFPPPPGIDSETKNYGPDKCECSVFSIGGKFFLDYSDNDKRWTDSGWDDFGGI